MEIVAGHLAEAENPAGIPVEMEGGVTSRLADEESPGVPQVMADGGEFAPVEMMEAQVCDDDAGLETRGEGFEEIVAVPGIFARQGVRGWGEVECGVTGGATGAVEDLGKVTGPRAELQDGRWQRFMSPFAEFTEEPAVVAHQRVEKPEIAPTVQGARVAGRQMIENLGSDDAARHGDGYALPGGEANLNKC